MKKINLTEEELATMSYDDVAYIILEVNGNKMKIQDLFKEVIKIMKLQTLLTMHVLGFLAILMTFLKIRISIS